MSFDREFRRVEDIVANIDLAIAYLGDHDEASFAADRKTMDAVERCLQRLTEAAIRIGAERMSLIAPDLPMSEVRGLGNMLRHEYENIDALTIFNTVQFDLPALKTSVAYLADLRNG
ncbi:HepT-like ribonuclease domain-containing protein [Sphingomonas sp. 1P06PA]|uniref:HepT-like ribonuclease domain-containing protein n=1 Tax=Sphingomonas sp. 1P06PA TaxID=554121 RepID=UPI0039A48E88